MNATGLAFDREGYLYASSRAEGTVYRISPDGAISTYAEGMGIATGIAFDRDGNLYVGDRSGTIFKINSASREIFVFATLEPSIAAYHLAFNDSRNALRHRTDHLVQSGHPRHRPRRQHHRLLPGPGPRAGHGLRRRRQPLRRCQPSRPARHHPHHALPEATFAVSGNDLVGLAFVEDGCAVLATRDALYHVALDVEGRRLF